MSKADQTKRRRSKRGDIQGDFKCTKEGCGKQYLSYPALYTHIKSKHGVEYLKDMSRPSPVGGRGRPRRDELNTIQTVEQPQISLKIQIEAKQSIDDFLLDLVENEYKQILQAETDIISNDDLRNKIYSVLKFISSNITSKIENDTFMNTLVQVLNRNEHNYKDEKDLIKIGCDEAFCIFIQELSYTLNLKFLKEIFYFLLSFRNYIFTKYPNTQYTFQLKFGNLLNNFMEEKINYFNESILQKFYIELQDNDKIFLNSRKSEELQKKIGLHFCNWLYHSRYAGQEVQLR